MEVNMRRWMVATALIGSAITISNVLLLMAVLIDFGQIVSTASDLLYRIDPECSSAAVESQFEGWVNQFAPPGLTGTCAFGDRQRFAIWVLVMPAALATGYFSISFALARRADCDPAVPPPTKKRILQAAFIPLVATLFLNGLFATLCYNSTTWSWCTPKSNSLVESVPWVDSYHSSFWLAPQDQLNDKLQLLKSGGCALVSDNLVYFSDSLVALEVGLVPTEYLLVQLDRILGRFYVGWILLGSISALFTLIQFAIAHNCPAQPYQPLPLEQNPPPPPSPGHQPSTPPSAAIAGPAAAPTPTLSAAIAGPTPTPHNPLGPAVACPDPEIEICPANRTSEPEASLEAIAAVPVGANGDAERLLTALKKHKFVAERPLTIINVHLYKIRRFEMEDRLVRLLERGYAEGEDLGAFRSLERAQESELRTLCGLIVGQRVAFKDAQKGRARFFRWMDENVKTRATDILSAQLNVNQKDVIISILLGYALPDLEIQMIQTPAFRFWASRKIPWAGYKLAKIVDLWKVGTPTIDAILGCKGVGIGPWTRKAFELLCRKGQHLLFEDAWVNKRWAELTHALKQNERLLVPTLRELDRSNATQMDKQKVTFLLWRITTAGVRRLTANKKLDIHSFLT